MPAAVKISHTVVAPTRCPNRASSPWILRQPQRGFSLTSRNISLHRQVAKDAELLALRHENAVLRRQLSAATSAPTEASVSPDTPVRQSPGRRPNAPVRPRKTPMSCSDAFLNGTRSADTPSGLGAGVPAESLNTGLEVCALE